VFAISREFVILRDSGGLYLVKYTKIQPPWFVISRFLLKRGFVISRVYCSFILTLRLRLKEGREEEEKNDISIEREEILSHLKPTEEEQASDDILVDELIDDSNTNVDSTFDDEDDDDDDGDPKELALKLLRSIGAVRNGPASSYNVPQDNPFESNE
jgi:hypothetical protein